MRNTIWLTCLFGLFAAVALCTSACMTGLNETRPDDPNTDSNSNAHSNGDGDDDYWKLEGAWAEAGKAWDGIVFDAQKRAFELNCADERYVQDGSTDKRILVAFTSARNGILEIDQDKVGEITEGLERITYSFEEGDLILDVTWETESVRVVFFKVELGASCTEGDDDEDEDENEEYELDTDGKICGGAPIACDRTYIGLMDCGFISDGGQEAFCYDCRSWHVDEELDCFYNLSDEQFEGDQMGCDWVFDQCSDVLEESSWYSG